MKSLNDFKIIQTLSSKFPGSEKWIFMLRVHHEYSLQKIWHRNPIENTYFKEICIALQFPMVVMNSVFLDNLIHWRSFVDVLYTVRWLYLSLFKIINFHTLSYEVLVLWNLKQYVRMYTSIIIDTLYIGGS